MKLMYFLQSLRDVQLGYSFRLYTYGPYDGQVLEDLRVVEALGGIRSEEFEWSGGSGYVLLPGEHADAIIARGGSELTQIDNDLRWVTSELGTLSAGDLELASTIVYVDRESSRDGEVINVTDITARVHEIKPRHSQTKILTEVDRLRREGLLTSLR
jgi:hypothetical protein